MEIKQEVTGKWNGIMESLGIAVGDGSHTACPICGPGNNSHRFRWDDIDGQGTWICNNCGAGNGWSLVMKVFNIDFKTAVEKIKPLLGYIEKTPPTPKKEADPKAMAKLYKISNHVRKGDLVWKYLESRGLGECDPKINLGFCPSCYEFETKNDQPAMLATFSDQNGNPISIHRTYLTKDGGKMDIKSPKKFLKTGNKLSGGACRLFNWSGGPLGIAEGVETAIAVSIVHGGMPVWACCSSSLMVNMLPPKDAEIEIFGDNDSMKTFGGQSAAWQLAEKLAIKGYSVSEPKIPPTPGNDWLDEYIKTGEL